MSDNQAPRIRTFRNELPTHTHTRPQALPSIYNIPKLPELPEPTTTTSSTMVLVSKSFESLDNFAGMFLHPYDEDQVHFPPNVESITGKKLASSATQDTPMLVVFTTHKPGKICPVKGRSPLRQARGSSIRQIEVSVTTPITTQDNTITTISLGALMTRAHTEDVLFIVRSFFDNPLTTYKTGVQLLIMDIVPTHTTCTPQVRIQWLDESCRNIGDETTMPLLEALKTIMLAPHKDMFTTTGTEEKFRRDNHNTTEEFLGQSYHVRVRARSKEESKHPPDHEWFPDEACSIHGCRLLVGMLTDADLIDDKVHMIPASEVRHILGTIMGLRIDTLRTPASILETATMIEASLASEASDEILRRLRETYETWAYKLCSRREKVAKVARVILDHNNATHTTNDTTTKQEPDNTSAKQEPNTSDNTSGGGCATAGSSREPVSQPNPVPSVTAGRDAHSAGQRKISKGKRKRNTNATHAHSPTPETGTDSEYDSDIFAEVDLRSLSTLSDSDATPDEAQRDTGPAPTAQRKQDSNATKATGPQHAPARENKTIIATEDALAAILPTGEPCSPYKALALLFHDNIIRATARFCLDGLPSEAIFAQDPAVWIPKANFAIRRLVEALNPYDLLKDKPPLTTLDLGHRVEGAIEWLVRARTATEQHNPQDQEHNAQRTKPAKPLPESQVAGSVSPDRAQTCNSYRHELDRIMHLYTGNNDLAASIRGMRNDELQEALWATFTSPGGQVNAVGEVREDRITLPPVSHKLINVIVTRVALAFRQQADRDATCQTHISPELSKKLARLVCEFKWHLGPFLAASQAMGGSCTNPAHPTRTDIQWAWESLRLGVEAFMTTTGWHELATGLSMISNRLSVTANASQLSGGQMIKFFGRVCDDIHAQATDFRAGVGKRPNLVEITERHDKLISKENLKNQLERELGRDLGLADNRARGYNYTGSASSASSRGRTPPARPRARKTKFSPPLPIFQENKAPQGAGGRTYIQPPSHQQQPANRSTPADKIMRVGCAWQNKPRGHNPNYQRVVKGLIRQYPQVCAQYLVGDCKAGPIDDQKRCGHGRVHSVPDDIKSTMAELGEPDAIFSE